MKSKKSQSPIIATILLILIAVSAAAIISTFAISFARDQLKKTDCFDVAGKLEISTNPSYTCYDSNNNLLVQVHLLDADIDGFVIELGGASTINYRISNAAVIPVIGMYNKTKGAPLEFPGKNEERTYNITSSNNPESVAVYPIVGEKICESSDSINEVINC